MTNNGKYRIAILGVGGVGGYVGGKLAYAYADHKDIEIIFIARGENKRRIQEHGLRLITPRGEWTCFPSFVSDDPGEIGIIDLLISTVKTYDLAESISRYKSCLASGTVILPLENGVNAAGEIKAVVPGATTWQGCVYLNSRLTEPGVVTKAGDVHIIYFGSTDPTQQSELKKVEAILKASGIDATVPENVEQSIWEKFVFISSIATATSYLDTSIGGIVASPQHKALLLSLADEVLAVARAKGITLPADMAQRILDRAAAMPYDSTSSMHSDFRSKKRTELDSLTGYIVEQGRIFHIPTPNYDRIYAALAEKRP